MTPEQIEQEFARVLAHRAEWGDGTQYISVADAVRITASLMPQATETVEFGIRVSPGLIAKFPIDAQTAADYAAHGDDIHRRTVTTYAPVVGEWEVCDE